MKWALIMLIRVYQVLLSPLLGGHCRFEPSCSRYGVEAIRRYGAWRGGWMTARRVGRCHPFSEGGYDPVPYEQDLGKSTGNEKGEEGGDQGSEKAKDRPGRENKVE